MGRIWDKTVHKVIYQHCLQCSAMIWAADTAKGPTGSSKVLQAEVCLLSDPPFTLSDAEGFAQSETSA